MALIGLAQPGQIVLLATGVRGDAPDIRKPLLKAGPFVLALQENFEPHLEPLTNLCATVESDLPAPEFVAGINRYFQLLPVEERAGAIAAGYFPGGNPFFAGFSPGAGVRQFFPLVLGGGLPESVAGYIMGNVYSPFMSHDDGLDLCVLMGIQYAETLRVMGYPDGFDVALLRTGESMSWLGEEGLQPSIDRTHRRLAGLRIRMLEIVDR